MSELESLSSAGQLLLDMVGNAKGDYHELLGVSLIDYRKGWGKAMLPYSPHLVGNIDTGSLHGGVITSLLDTCMGFTVATTVDVVAICPTLDLRIDYMGVAKPHLPLFAEAEVYRSTQHIIFVRGKAYQTDIDKPVAFATATFVRLGAESTPSIQEYVNRNRGE